jgi:hypothetical protein
MNPVVKNTAFAVFAAAVILLSSCVSVNNLDKYDFGGSRLAVDMHTPPEPRLNVDYDIMMNSHSAVITALSVVTNLAKANEAHKAREVMREALMDVDVPEIIRAQSFNACASALGSDQVGSRRQADYMLVLQIDEWGIDARSPVSAVSLHIRMLASLYPVNRGELAWRREITVDQPADPDMFGIGPIIGNMVTATVLYNMTQDDMVRGFKQLASLTARRIARDLEDDLDYARFKK